MDEVVRLRHVIEGQDQLVTLRGNYDAARTAVENLYKQMGQGPAFTAAAQPHLETMVRLTDEIRNQERQLNVLQHGWLGAVGGLRNFTYVLDDLQYVGEQGLRPILNNLAMMAPQLAVAGIAADQVYRNWSWLTKGLRDDTGQLDVTLERLGRRVNAEMGNLGRWLAGVEAPYAGGEPTGAAAIGRRLEELKKRGDDINEADRMERDYLENRQKVLARSQHDLDALRNRQDPGEAALAPILEDILNRGGGREAVERYRSQMKLEIDETGELKSLREHREALIRRRDEIVKEEVETPTLSLNNLIGGGWRRTFEMSTVNAALTNMDAKIRAAVRARADQIDVEIAETLRNIQTGHGAVQDVAINRLREILTRAGVPAERAGAEAAALANRSQVTPEQQAEYAMATQVGGGTPAAAIEFARERAQRLEAEYSRLLKETGGVTGTHQEEQLRNRVNQATLIYDRLNTDLGGVAATYEQYGPVMALNRERAQTLNRFFEAYAEAIERGEDGESELGRLREETARVLRENLADKVGLRQDELDDEATLSRVRRDLARVMDERRRDVARMDLGDQLRHGETDDQLIGQITGRGFSAEFARTQVEAARRAEQEARDREVQAQHRREDEREVMALHLAEQIRQGARDEELIAEFRRRGFGDEFARAEIAKARVAEDDRRAREDEARRERGMQGAAAAILPAAMAGGLGQAMLQADRRGEAIDTVDARLRAQVAQRFGMDPEAARRVVEQARRQTDEYLIQQRAIMAAAGPLASPEARIRAALQGAMGPEAQAAADVEQRMAARAAAQQDAARMMAGSLPGFGAQRAAAAFLNGVRRPVGGAPAARDGAAQAAGGIAEPAVAAALGQAGRQLVAAAGQKDQAAVGALMDVARSQLQAATTARQMAAAYRAIREQVQSIQQQLQRVGKPFQLPGRQ